MRVGRFGPFEVNLTTGELRKHGIRLKVQDQPFQILALLLARPETLVTREEICQRLWPSGTFVDFDNGLNTALSRLREALGDSAESPRYIETLARRGYRWMVSVDWSTSSSADLPASDSVDASSGEETTESLGDDSDRAKSSGARVKLIYGSLLAVALLMLGLVLFWFKGQRSTFRKVLSERQITHSLPDNMVLNGEISPDGKNIAYVDTKGLHLIVIESGESHDIALPEEVRTNLHEVSWFPDGEKLIIRSRSESEGEILWLISVFGGALRKLRTAGYGVRVSPDGSLIAFIANDWREIWVVGADGGNAKRILNLGSATCEFLAWSPAGKRLAYLKTLQEGNSTIETLSLDGEPPSVVVSDPSLTTPSGSSIAWLHDGRLVYSSGENNNVNLWEIMTDLRTGLPYGNPSKLTNWSGANAFSPSVSRDGNRLVAIKHHSWNDVYVGELQEHGTRLDSPKRLTSSDSRNHTLAWTADSGTILFSSDRTGRFQIFKQRVDADASEPLAQSSDDQIGGMLSPDGAWILYWSFAHEGKSPPTSQRLMRIPASGGSPERVLELPIEPMVEVRCPSRPSGSCLISRWDRGQIAFYALDALQGQGKEITRTKLGRSSDLDWSISPDGSRIAIYTQFREPIRILELRNGAERNLRLPQVWAPMMGLDWAADSSAIFAGVVSTTRLIARIDLDGKTHVLLEQKNGVLGGPRASPDGRYLAYFKLNQQTNMWLLENF